MFTWDKSRSRSLDRVCTPSTYRHRYVPRPLSFCHFSLRGVYTQYPPWYWVHTATRLFPVYWTPTAMGISVRCVPATSGLIPIHRRMGIHLSWSALPPTSMDVGLFFRVRSVPSAMGQSGILPEVGSVPPTRGQSVSGVFFEGFCLWSRFGPPSCCRTFAIFSWKLGIVVMSDNTFQCWYH